MPATVSVRPTTPSSQAHWPGSAEALRRLGISRAQLRRLSDEGRLRGQTDARGHWHWNPEDVEREALRRAGRPAAPRASVGNDEGALASRAFALFAAEGIDLRKAVVQLNVTLEVADRLARDYARAGGETLLILRDPTATTIRNMLGSRFEDEQGFLAALAARDRRQHEAHVAQLAERERAATEERTRLESENAQLRADLETAVRKHDIATREIAALRQAADDLEMARAALARQVAELRAQAGRASEQQTAPPLSEPAAPAP